MAEVESVEAETMSGEMRADKKANNDILIVFRK
jgi:hypothetical protein